MATSLEELEVLENMHRIMDMYMWLANALGMAMFPKYAEVAAKRIELAEVISRSVQTAFKVDQKIVAAALPKGQLQADQRVLQQQQKIERSRNKRPPKAGTAGAPKQAEKRQKNGGRRSGVDAGATNAPSVPPPAWAGDHGATAVDLLPPVIMVPEEAEADVSLLAAVQRRKSGKAAAAAAAAAGAGGKASGRS